MARTLPEHLRQDERLLRLFESHDAGADAPDVRALVADLRHMVVSLAQEVAVLEEMLQESGHWDRARYRDARRRRMVADHDSSGLMSWRHCSYYRYTLDEPDFLRTQLGATEADVERFQAEVDEVSTRT